MKPYQGQFYKLAEYGDGTNLGYYLETKTKESIFPVVHSFLVKSFTAPGVSFEDFVIPGKTSFQEYQVGTIFRKLGGEQSFTAAFTFPTHKDKFYLWYIFFDSIPVNTLMNIAYGKSSNRISFNAFLIQRKFYSTTLVVDFPKIFGVPMEIKANDAVLFEFYLPNDYKEEYLSAFIIFS
jgi:hypothetical protein